MILGIEAAHATKQNRTGVEEYCFQMIQELKKIVPANVQVILYSHIPLAGELGNLPANWQVKVLRWPLKKLWSQIRLSFELLFHPPDVFFAPGQLIPFFCPKNTVVTIHDSAFVAVPKTYWLFSRWYLKWMNTQIVHRAKTIFVSAEFNKKELIKFYGAAAGDKAKVIPLAFDSQRFTHQPPSPEILKKYFLTKPYLISIGRLETKKNTHQIIEAFNLLRKQYDLQLLLIGNPGRHKMEYEKVAQAIISSPFKSDIILAGYIDAQNIPALLSGAQVFVFPSAYEGFGIPILEAFACGCPVVTALNAALPEVAGAAALYADSNHPADIAAKISSLLSDKDARARFIAAGYARARLFNWQKTAQATWSEIVRLANF